MQSGYKVIFRKTKASPHANYSIKMKQCRGEAFESHRGRVDYIELVARVATLLGQISCPQGTGRGP